LSLGKLIYEESAFLVSLALGEFVIEGLHDSLGPLQRLVTTWAEGPVSAEIERIIRVCKDQLGAERRTASVLRATSSFRIDADDLTPAALGIRHSRKAEFDGHSSALAGIRRDPGVRREG
jgi:hypothetical protein